MCYTEKNKSLVPVKGIQKMILFNKSDFLEFFGNERIIDEKANTILYSVISQEGLTFTVYVDPQAQFVGLNMTSQGGALMGIGLHKIIRITLERKEPVVKFCFHQESQPEPIASFMIKPSIAIYADLLGNR